MTKKMEEAKDAGVRVVSEDFLADIKSSGKALQELVSLHAISPWGAEVKVEAQASSAASKSGPLATKSTGKVKVKEEEGKGTFILLLLICVAVFRWFYKSFVMFQRGDSSSVIVPFSFLYVLMNNSNCVTAGGSKSKKMKLTVKGGAAVDPDSGRHEHSALETHLCSFFAPVLRILFIS